MLTSKKHALSIFSLSILFHCSAAKPQYFPSALDQTTEHNEMKDGNVGNTYETHADYYNQPGQDFLSDSWLSVNALPTQESSNVDWPPGVLESLNLPVYAENQFNSDGSQSENLPLNTNKDYTDQFERGRSDIEPEEEEEEFGGYFYPKPKISFDLPDFKPVNAGLDVEASFADDAIVTTASNIAGTSTEKTTTASTVQSNPGSSDRI